MHCCPTKSPFKLLSIKGFWRAIPVLTQCILAALQLVMHVANRHSLLLPCASMLHGWVSHPKSDRCPYQGRCHNKRRMLMQVHLTGIHLHDGRPLGLSSVRVAASASMPFHCYLFLAHWDSFCLNHLLNSGRGVLSTCKLHRQINRGLPKASVTYLCTAKLCWSSLQRYSSYIGLQRVTSM